MPSIALSSAEDKNKVRRALPTTVSSLFLLITVKADHPKKLHLPNDYRKFMQQLLRGYM